MQFDRPWMWTTLGKWIRSDHFASQIHIGYHVQLYIQRRRTVSRDHARISAEGGVPRNEVTIPRHGSKLPVFSHRGSQDWHMSKRNNNVVIPPKQETFLSIFNMTILVFPMSSEQLTSRVASRMTFFRSLFT